MFSRLSMGFMLWDKDGAFLGRLVPDRIEFHRIHLLLKSLRVINLGGHPRIITHQLMNSQTCHLK